MSKLLLNFLVILGILIGIFGAALDFLAAEYHAPG